ncbi:MAG: hypothetical protein RL367_379 [Pseudomonadota bacterium]|jgi:UrcA family protein
MTIITKIIAAAAFATLATGAATAQSVETRNVPVRHGDLDLNTPAGQTKLASRVRHAAVQACENGSDARDLGAQAQFQTCVKAATGRAMASITAQAPAVGTGNQ